MFYFFFFVGFYSFMSRVHGARGRNVCMIHNIMYCIKQVYGSFSLTGV